MKFSVKTIFILLFILGFTSSFAHFDTTEKKSKNIRKGLEHYQELKNN